MASPGAVDADEDPPVPSTSRLTTLQAPLPAVYARTSLSKPSLIDNVSRRGLATSSSASGVVGLPDQPLRPPRQASIPPRYARSASITSLRSLEEAGRLALRRRASVSSPPAHDTQPLVEEPESEPPPSRGWLDLIAGTGLTRARTSEGSTSTAVPIPVLNPAEWLPSGLFSAKPLPTEEAGPDKDKKDHKDSKRYLDEADKPKDGELPWARVQQHYEKPKLPLVMCHGLFGFDMIGPQGMPMLQISYWRGVKAALESIDCEVLITSVPTSASIEERAKMLCETIERELPGREINLIGHSMGGLDARFLTSVLRPTTFTVRSITTIATPHRGSPFADYMLDDIIGKQHMPKILKLCESIGLPGGGKAFDNLTTYSMTRFNHETPDLDGVVYLSYGAAFEPGYLNVFRTPWGVINEKEGANDGLVSVESSKWGEYLGTLEDVDHLSLVGWTGPLRFGWAAWFGRPINFRPASFFLSMAENLALRGL